MPAGYSGTPLLRKLGIKEGMRIAFVSPPDALGELLGPLPAGVTVATRAGAPLDFIALFAPSASALRRAFVLQAARLKPAGMIWVAWPKKASGVATDLSEGVVRETGLNAGLVDVKVCAIDDVWSGLKFVVRLKDRPRA